jgi:ribonuclease J
MTKKPPAPLLDDLRPKDGVVRVIPLGGLGEIGMNCYLFEYNGEMILVDCGQMMPDEDMLGVDYVIPDISYILARPKKLAAIIITHAHEDHIGGLPYILPRLPGDIPIYAGELTICLLKEKLREHKVSPNFKQFEARRKFAVGKNFMIEPIAVTHSMIGAFALAITTPIGTLIHSGDFKIDPAPMDGVCFDFHAFTRYAEGDKDGVLALLSDSTGADRPGTCPSEVVVIPTIDRLVREATGQVIFCTFASSLHRIQTVLNVAAKHDRLVLAAGLNMERNIRVASSIGAIEVPCRYESDIDKVGSYPANKRLILTTGSQGEPMSGLTKMAYDNHRAVQVNPGDTVIISARLIPGNEKAIYRMINHLIRRGAKVYYPGNTTNLHVSGHAFQDDLRQLLNLVNPKFLVPMHGEYRHLKAHGEMAELSGMTSDEIMILENGDCLEIGKQHARVIGKVPHGRVFVDGRDMGDVEEVVIRDRKFLSEDGVVMVMLSVDRESGDVLGGPFLHSRGFMSEDELKEIQEDAVRVVLDAYHSIGAEEREESSAVQAIVKKALKGYLKRKTKRIPVILPVIMEI